jgi:hypothetical protein
LQRARPGDVWPLSSDERIGSDRFPLALALIPKMEEVAAALRMGLTPALDHDVIAADAALAVEQRRCENPRATNLELLRSLTRDFLGILAAFWRNRQWNRPQTL